MLEWSVDFFEVLFDGLALCICAFAVLYLFIKRVPYHAFYLKEAAEEVSQSFEETLSQLVRQSGLAYEALFETLKQERLAILELMEKDKTKGEKKQGVAETRTEPLREKRERQWWTSATPDEDPYAEAVKLAGLGLSAKEISKRARIPKGELDLIIKLETQC